MIDGGLHGYDVPPAGRLVAICLRA